MHSMEEIYREHSKSVYAFLMVKTKNPDIAEELTQETFFEAVKNINRYKGKSNVLTWLCGIARNLWYQYLRDNKKKFPLDDAEDILVASTESEVFCNWENIQTIKLLHGLNEPIREVMYLRLIGNLSYRQIGEIMGQSENWARVMYYRGKEKIVKEAKRNE